MKSSDHIFILLEIYPCFSTNTTVYLSKQCRWNLDKINTSKISSCSKSGKITYNTTAQSNKETLPVKSVTDQRLIQTGNGIQIFIFFSGLKSKHGNIRAYLA